MRDVLANLKQKSFSVLDKGTLEVLDVMPRLVENESISPLDAAVVQAARVSLKANLNVKLQSERNLIRYLFSHRHTVPFEHVVLKFHVKCPIFVARQWVKHRTACLAGDVRLHFDLPGGISRRGCQKTSLTVKQIFDKFQPTVNSRSDKQGNPYHKRDRVKKMRLRSCNEIEGTVYHTTIEDIWQTGVKPVIKLDFGNGNILRATKDHLCFTDKGWLKLSEALESGAKFGFISKGSGFVSDKVVYSNEEMEHEIWKPYPLNKKYEISNLGRVRNNFNTRNVKMDKPLIKKQTLSNHGYPVVTLCANGVCVPKLVHQLVLETFDSPRPKDCETRHLDGNRQNNKLENLAWGTTKENAKDRMTTGCSQRLSVSYISPISVIDDGEEMTYDIQVSGPFHNFSAGGVVVHNSLSEISGRYCELTDDYYEPDEYRKQSTDNKQGSLGIIENPDVSLWLDHYFEDLPEETFEQYHTAIKEGVAMELARINLPLSTYTEFIWKIDLHNLLHFIALREDEHAQQEIRDYARILSGIVKDLAPITHEAFEDYHPMRNACLFSAPEMDILSSIWDNRELLAYGNESFMRFWVSDEDNRTLLNRLTKRERKALSEKLNRLGIPPLPSDL